MCETQSINIQRNDLDDEDLESLTLTICSSLTLTLALTYTTFYEFRTVNYKNKTYKWEFDQVLVKGEYCPNF